MPASHWALGRRKGRRVPNGVGCYVAAIHPLFTGPPLPNEYIHNGVEWREADAITVFGYGKVDVVRGLPLMTSAKISDFLTPSPSLSTNSRNLPY